MKNHIEDDNQELVIRWCELNKIKYPSLKMIFSIPNGGKRNPREAARLKRQGVRAGIPDLFLASPRIGSIWPHSGDEHGFFIEMKSEKGTVNKNQLPWILELRESGYKVDVCYSWIEAVNEIIDYLGLPEKMKV